MNSVQLNPALNSAAVNSLLNSQGDTQQAVQNGDFFAAFLQMLTNQATGENPLDQLSSLGIVGDTNSEDPTNPNENDAAMEMAAGLLSGTYGFDWLLSGTMENNELSYASMLGMGNFGGENQISEMASSGLGQNSALMSSDNQSPFGSENSGSKLLSQMMLLQNIQSALNTNQGTAGQQATAVAQTAQGSVLQNNETATGFSVQSAQNTNTELQAQQIVSVTANQKGENSAEMLYNGDMNFKSAIAQAQKLMKNDSAKDDKQFAVNEATIDTTAISGTQVQNSDLSATKVTSIDLDDLTKQINAGISKGELTEKKEISVKLKPEGLGEVTIKLVKEANQIKVSIVAASEQTAKLLNDSLPTLRQTMRANGSDVNEVLVTGHNNFENAQENFNGQMFMGQQNEQNQAYSSASHRNSYYSDDIGSTEGTQQLKEELVENGMKIYV